MVTDASKVWGNGFFRQFWEKGPMAVDHLLYISLRTVLAVRPKHIT